MTSDLVAVAGPDPWGAGKRHAADRGSGVLPTSGPASHRSQPVYATLCGLRNMRATRGAPAFDAGALDACQRCVRLA